MTERPYSPSDFEATVLLWRRTWERTFPMLKHPWTPGIGSALLAKAKDLSPTGLRLETLQQNMGARGFYERRGFRPGTMSVNPINGQPNVEYIWPGR